MSMRLCRAQIAEKNAAVDVTSLVPIAHRVVHCCGTQCGVAGALVRPGDTVRCDVDFDLKTMETFVNGASQGAVHADVVVRLLACCVCPCRLVCWVSYLRGCEVIALTGPPPLYCFRVQGRSLWPAVQLLDGGCIVDVVSLHADIVPEVRAVSMTCTV